MIKKTDDKKEKEPEDDWEPAKTEIAALYDPPKKSKRKEQNL